MSDGGYAYRVRQSGTSWSIGVPPDLAQKIPSTMVFAFRTTAKGFAYEVVDDAPPEGLPEWLTERLPPEEPEEEKKPEEPWEDWQDEP